MVGVVIPLHERPEFIRAIAKVLGKKNGEQANVYWRHMAMRLLRLSMAMGAHREAAEADVRRLLHTVLGEIQKSALKPAD